MSKHQERINKERSANLPITAEREAGSYVLNEDDPAKPKPSSGFLGFIVGGIFILVFLSLAPLFAVMAFIVILFNRPTRQKILAYFFLRPGELVFTHYPLQLGSDRRVTFRRKLKGDRRFFADSSITVRLLCMERISYTKGSDTIIETAVVEERTLLAFYQPPWDWRLQPPVGAIPSESCAIAYWDEANRIPLPRLMFALHQAYCQRATIVAATHWSLKPVARTIGFPVKTIRLATLNPHSLRVWVQVQLASEQLPERSLKVPSLSPQETAEAIAYA